MLRLCSVLVLCLATTSALAAERLSGPAHVLDGDTIKVLGASIRLHGIDAPEAGQPCTAPDGKEADCGTLSRKALSALVAGRSVICDPLDRDRHGRIVARCTAGQDDLGRRMVEDGWAYAYRRYAMDYDLAEKRAYVQGRGLHAYRVVAPETYRAADRAPARQNSAGCAIKGNISAGGRIYHLPGQKDYDRVTISPSRGERWFCSEPQARAAGWRRAIR
jgi:endonuclease YncB( thermonuclease family)